MSIKRNRFGIPATASAMFAATMFAATMFAATMLAATMLLSSTACGQDVSKSIQIKVPLVNLLKGNLDVNESRNDSVLRLLKQVTNQRQPVPDRPSLAKGGIESSVESLLVDSGNLSGSANSPPNRSVLPNSDASKANSAENDTAEFEDALFASSRAKSENPSVEPGLIDWHADLKAAASQSIISGKPVFHFQLLGQLGQRFTWTNARIARTVLFSNQEIADFINENFEPTWESVRPVPRVTIDFGNGTVVNRTLHGNVATYVCNAKQVVQDVLPGLYSKAACLQQLKRISEQWQVGHAGISASVKRDLASSRNAKTKQSLKVERATQSLKLSTILARQKLDENLVLDTLYNEQERRDKIEDYLALHPKSTPSQMKGWLYREVLHADLDDPYLGLRNALFDNYPFVDD